MRVLVVKTSSMGDVIHTLPALSDASQAIPGIQFDWLVEEAFAQIPSWHPSINRVIPVALRRWRKRPKQLWRSGELRAFYRDLTQTHYDLIIDAQGLFKSSVLSRLARGKRVGLDRHSARESIASFLYQEKHCVTKSQHAIARTRDLFAKALGYACPTDVPDYGIDQSHFTIPCFDRYVVLVHGTTWSSKLWPEAHWVELAKLAQLAGLQVKLPWGNETERLRAGRIASECAGDWVEVLPKLDLKCLAQTLQNATAVVAVDTGLGHLSAALAVPLVSIYGPTDPDKIAAMGLNCTSLQADFPCAPCGRRECTFKGDTGVQPACLASISPARVWAAVNHLT